MQGSISVQTIRSYLRLASAGGLDAAATAEAAGAVSALEDLDGRVSWPICERIAHEIVARVGVATAVGAMANMGDRGVGLLYYVARHSATVGSALQRVVQYYAVTSSVADCDLIADGSPARIELRQRSYVRGPVRQLISALWAVANVVTIRQMVGDSFNPISVDLEMPRPVVHADVAAIESALRSPVRFEALRSSVAVPLELLEQRVNGADPVLEAAVIKYAAEMLDRVEAQDADTVRARLRHHLVDSIHSGDIALPVAARQLGTTGRTLQRRLREEGTSFQEVLDEVRRDVALAQMRARRQSIDEVAFVLGFEKSSSFHRAFKRWTGLTPGEFRKQG